MDELLGRQSAFQEAKALYRMIGDEHTVEGLRELIAVPQRIEAVLLAFARAHPEEAHFVDRTLRFREAVAREFERLVAEGVPIAEVPEVEESEPDAEEELDVAEETYAGAPALFSLSCWLYAWRPVLAERLSGF